MLNDCKLAHIKPTGRKTRTLCASLLVTLNVRFFDLIATKRKAPITKTTERVAVYADSKYWRVRVGALKRGKGHPGKAEHLLKVVGEKLPLIALSSVGSHFIQKELLTKGGSLLRLV